MRPKQLLPRSRESGKGTVHSYRRRGFLALGASVGATLLAGCAGDTDGAGTTTDTTEGPDGASGTFRLLISDRPADIDDFDELAVSFDRARIFRREETDDDEEGGTDTESTTSTGTAETTETTTGTETTTETATNNETTTATTNETATETATDGPDDESGEDDERGFFTADLDGATVDLTEVVGEKAIGVFEGELPAGRYSKIELYASDVEGIVGGEPAKVKIPSGKLQIVKPFEVVAGESLSFVFDINVVKKGQGADYNLLPVIAESGVAGSDVEVSEVEEGNDDAETGESDDGDGMGNGAGENQSDDPDEDS